MALKSIQSAFESSAAAGEAEYRKQKTLGRVGSDYSTLELLGFRFFAKQQPKTAIAVWELEVREFPAAWRAFDSLGLAYRMQGDRERSIASYQRALGINPADDTAKKALASGR